MPLPTLQPIHPQTLALLRRMLDEEALLCSMPEGWVICAADGLRRQLVPAATAFLLREVGLVAPVKDHPCARYFLTDEGRRAYYAGGFFPRRLR